MIKTFYAPTREGRNQWWTYCVTFLLIVSGIVGFGNMPLMFAMASKGYSIQKMEAFSVADYQKILGQNLFFTVNLFPFVIGFVMLLVAYKFVHRRSVMTLFTLRQTFDLKRFIVAFIATGVLLGGLFLIGYLQGHEQLVWNFNAEKFFTLLMICLFIVPLQTGFEELLFRGYLLKLFGRATSKGLLIILVNGILFGLLHIMNPEIVRLGWFAMAFYIFSGIFAAFLTVMDDGIELSWGFHTANNFMGMLIVTNQWQVFQTDTLFIDTAQPQLGLDMYVMLFAGYPLLIFVFARIYKWSGWKERLLGR